jgi:hypothetical protein
VRGRHEPGRHLRCAAADRADRQRQRLGFDDNHNDAHDNNVDDIHWRVLER